MASASSGSQLLLFLLSLLRRKVLVFDKICHRIHPRVPGRSGKPPASNHVRSAAGRPSLPLLMAHTQQTHACTPILLDCTMSLTCAPVALTARSLIPQKSSLPGTPRRPPRSGGPPSVTLAALCQFHALRLKAERRPPRLLPLPRRPQGGRVPLPATALEPGLNSKADLHR